MLPPTCTRVLPSATWTSRAKSLLTPLTRRSLSKKRKGNKGAASGEDGKSVGDDVAEAAAAVLNQAGKGKEKVERAVNVGSAVLCFFVFDHWGLNTVFHYSCKPVQRKSPLQL